MLKKEGTSVRKRRKKRNGISFIGILLLAFVVYISVNILLTSGNRIQTTIVQKGEEEELISAEGYIFREQTVINAPASGYLFCEAEEDQRVKTGEAVMSIYKNEINFQANSELKELDEKIKKLEGNSLEADVFSNDTVRVEQDIAQRLREVHVLSYNGDMKGIAEICSDVDGMIEKKRIISGGVEKTDKAGELAALKAEKAKIEQSNSVDRTIVHAPKSGAFTACIDGMEEMLGLDKVNGITPAYIRELDKQQIKNTVSEQVNAGAPVGKIVNNFTWSVAALVPYGDIELMNIGDEVRLRFPGAGGESVVGTVSAKSEPENKNAVLTVTSNKYVDMIYSTSKAEVEFIKNSYSGFRIPSEGIRIKDGKKGVFVVRSDIARFIPVKVLYSGKDWTVISEKPAEGQSKSVKLYDELIVSGKDIYDGKDVR